MEQNILNNISSVIQVITCIEMLFQIQGLMDRFETQFDNLDVQTQVMEGAMQDSSTLSTPQGEVDSLMQQVADEAGWVKDKSTDLLCIRE